MSIIIRPKDPEYPSCLVKIKLYDAVIPGEGREIDTIFGKTIDFAMLVKEFEEVKKEPLIKDDKIRKAVRAWAEANDYGEKDDYEFCDYATDLKNWGLRNRGSGDRNVIDFNDGIDFNRVTGGYFYTLAELCGEEEE